MRRILTDSEIRTIDWFVKLPTLITSVFHPNSKTKDQQNNQIQYCKNKPLFNTQKDNKIYQQHEPNNNSNVVVNPFPETNKSLPSTLFTHELPPTEISKQIIAKGKKGNNHD